MTNYFNGYIEVDSNTNIVIGIYDASDLNTNLIYPLSGPIIPPNPNIFGFANYQNNVLYDDAYKSIWQQFDTYGLIMKANNNINSSFYNSDYSYYNFYATSDPLANNGLIIGFDATGTTSIPRQVISSLTPVDNPICFNKDTKILCLKNDIEIYIKIQDILEGTLVKTYKHGYKKVNKIHKGILQNNPKKPFSCMYKMKKTDNMIDDLIVTGVTGGTTDGVGVETTNALSVAELRTSTIGGTSADINRTSGTIQMGFTDLLNSNSNGNSFSTTTEPSNIIFGVIGNLGSNQTYQLVPGTVTLGSLPAAPFEFPFTQDVIVISTLIKFTGTIGAGVTVSLHLHLNGSPIPSIVVTLNQGETQKVNNTTSIVCKTGDTIHVEAVTAGNPGNGTFLGVIGLY